jgi:hypothetical protein
MVIMLVFAVAAVATGLIQAEEAGRVNLGPWLTFEVMGGAAASVIGGVVSRRVAGRYRASVVLAGTVFAIGLVEAMEILGSIRAGSTEAPIWLAFLAPVVAAAGVLVGGSVGRASVALRHKGESAS